MFKGNADELVEYLPNLPETTCMVFVEDEVDKRSRMYKAVKKYGYAAEMERQSSGQLAKWAAGLLAKEGKKNHGFDHGGFSGKSGRGYGKYPFRTG